jgi:hypothetical protein
MRSVAAKRYLVDKILFGSVLNHLISWWAHKDSSPTVADYTRDLRLAKWGFGPSVHSKKWFMRSLSGVPPTNLLSRRSYLTSTYGFTLVPCYCKSIG